MLRLWLLCCYSCSWLLLLLLLLLLLRLVWRAADSATFLQVLLLDFAVKMGDDLSAYDEMEAWPVHKNPCCAFLK